MGMYLHNKRYVSKRTLMAGPYGIRDAMCFSAVKQIIARRVYVDLKKTTVRY